MSAAHFVRPATAALSFLVALCAFGADAAPAGKEPGDLWEVTSKMSMEGMPMEMPATTQKVCTAKTWSEPPGGNADKSCETLEFKNSATTTTWKVRCAGPPAMTGEGEITRSGPDAYKGTMKLSSPDGAMTMKLSGRRVGDCDRGESNREIAQLRGKIEAQAAAAQGQAAAAQATMCKGAVDAMDLRTMKAYASVCAGTPLKDQFCARLSTQEGFQLVCDRPADSGNSLADAASYCGKNADALKKPICEEALKTPSFELLGKCCPVQARELALQECAGRKYTALAGSKYQSFCLSYARDVMADGH
jgi:hypothetical protein